MESHTLLASITKNTYTLTDYQRKLRLIRNHFEHTFFHAPLEKMSAEDSAWLASVIDDSPQKLTQSTYQGVLQELQNHFRQSEVLQVCFPFPPTEDEIAELSTLLRKDHGPTLIFDIQVKPELLDGVVFIWKGKSYDYSMKRKLAESHTQLEDLVRRYIA